jgi:hypothetical protein
MIPRTQPVASLSLNHPLLNLFDHSQLFGGGLAILNTASSLVGTTAVGNILRAWAAFGQVSLLLWLSP